MDGMVNEMRHYIVIERGYVLLVGTGDGGEEITEERYDEIIEVIRKKPTVPDGYTYKLRADNLEWELVELPPPDPDPDLDDAEALEILLGGGGE